ncbi:MAG: hypothetical protein M3P18_20025 [Actinomycetota bacterium]|nr:hypothetical protein [Actinomycetota bacterium]
MQPAIYHQVLPGSVQSVPYKAQYYVAVCRYAARDNDHDLLGAWRQTALPRPRQRLAREAGLHVRGAEGGAPHARGHAAPVAPPDGGTHALQAVPPTSFGGSRRTSPSRGLPATYVMRDTPNPIRLSYEDADYRTAPLGAIPRNDRAAEFRRPAL